MEKFHISLLSAVDKGTDPAPFPVRLSVGEFLDPVGESVSSNDDKKVSTAPPFSSSRTSTELLLNLLLSKYLLVLSK
ncbi:hypothetical protein L798_13967 [Zootermopsis nevadensis]|uniref:Uncharacterized protein n=1 Tax=Zootermopsis nevadensis TaxID=136037 RepID=A0A067QPR3_ZOONE|nr:hypothetical protein L798_13967 [Zootermopsis nevadensis]